jgi:putative protease
MPDAPLAPELLAPAGDWDCLRAAVANGADAVYFGLDQGFNARARATNFTLADLPQVMAHLHRYQVRGYLTLNTLVFAEELPAVEALVRAAAEASVDAVLVQDLGLVRLIRAVCPGLAVHASTQMSLTSAECIAAAAELGVQRVVLARELSLREIAEVRRRCPLPLEVFVHGALCVAYSGQCLTSESLGGRSANRGQCAQACRLPYQLVCDGKDVDLGPVQYLLSPQDLAAFDLVPDLLAAGVAALKIEGRLKSPEYVANITRHYRQAIDAALAGHPREFTPRDVAEMELSFSRGFSPGWLLGNDHKRLVPGLSSAKRGVRLGTVRRVARHGVLVDLSAPLKRGDGVVFAGDRAAGREQGGRVFDLCVDGRSLDAPAESGLVELRFGPGAVQLRELFAGQPVWKTDDPELTARLRKSFADPRPPHRWPLDLQCTARPGEPLQIVATAELPDGLRTLHLASPQPLAAALRHPLTPELLREQFGRLGRTMFRLRSLAAHLDGQPMAPLSVLGRMRHELVAALQAAVERPPPHVVAPASVLPALLPSLPEPAPPGPPVLHVLCRSLAQLEHVLAAGARSVQVDFADIREYRPAVAAARSAGAELWLATPRIHKPDEWGILLLLARYGADGILARNLAALRFCADRRLPVLADYALNAANPLSVDWIRACGARRVTASYDLNREQLQQLAARVPGEWLELVIHQHMPMFHMEHCVFCAVLSPGTNKTNCGRPCDRHQVRLRDRVGMEHPLVADVGCRNTVFNALPQSAAEAVPALLRGGIRHFRVELLHDAPPAEIGRTLGLYQDLLAGRLRASDVWQALRAANRAGVTRGPLEERRNPLAIL